MRRKRKVARKKREDFPIVARMSWHSLRSVDKQWKCSSKVPLVAHSRSFRLVSN